MREVLRHIPLLMGITTLIICRMEIIPDMFQIQSIDKKRPPTIMAGGHLLFFYGIQLFPLIHLSCLHIHALI